MMVHVLEYNKGRTANKTTKEVVATFSLHGREGGSV